MKNIKFIKQTSDKMFINTFTNRTNSYRYVAINEKGQFGCLPGELSPYAPIGGVKALKEVVDILVFN